MAIKPKLMVQYIILELRILSCNNGNIIRNIVGLCKAAHSKHILPLQSLLALVTVIKILRKANVNLWCLPNSKFILAQLIHWPIVHKLKSGKQTRVTFNDCHLLRLTHNWFLSVILPTTLEMIGYILIMGTCISLSLYGLFYCLVTDDNLLCKVDIFSNEIKSLFLRRWTRIFSINN